MQLVRARGRFTGHSSAGHYEGRTADDKRCYLQPPQVGGVWMLGSEVKRSVEDDAEHGAGTGGVGGDEGKTGGKNISVKSPRETRLGGVNELDELVSCIE